MYRLSTVIRWWGLTGHCVAHKCLGFSTTGRPIKPRVVCCVAQSHRSKFLRPFFFRDRLLPFTRVLQLRIRLTPHIHGYHTTLNRHCLIGLVQLLLLLLRRAEIVEMRLTLNHILAIVALGCSWRAAKHIKPLCEWWTIDCLLRIDDFDWSGWLWNSCI